MKQFIKKLFGIDKLEAQKEQALASAELAMNTAKQAEEAAELAKMTPKQRANKRKEPWVAVLDTHINKENIRNGFFELDWNEYFIQELIKAGYGFEADPEEQIVDRWFRDLARNMLTEEGQDASRIAAGYINVNRISANQSEIS